MLYRWFNHALFLLGVGRFRAGDFRRNQRILGEVTRHRLVVLANATLLIVICGAIDAWLTPKLADWIDFGKADALVHSPSPAALETILQVIATSSAAVIALILSISLLALDRMSERFSSQVARLQIADPLRKYVVDILVTAFLLSLWGLFLSKEPQFQPIVTTILSGTFLSFGVATLILYHDHSFSLMLSSTAANSLENRCRDLLVRLQREAERPPIANYLRRSVGELIQAQSAFLRVLLRSGDDEGAAYVISALLGQLGTYVRMKHLIPAGSAWFPTMPVRLSPTGGSTYFEMRQMMRRAGLGAPTSDQRNHIWFEEAVSRAVEEARAIAIEIRANRSLSYEAESLAFLAEVSIEREHEWTESWVRKELTGLASKVDDSNLDTWGASVVNATARIAEAQIKSIEGIVDPASLAALDWHDDRALTRMSLPELQNAAVNRIRERLEVEIVSQGSVITPPNELARELEAELRKVRIWHEDGLDALIELVRHRQEGAGGQVG